MDSEKCRLKAGDKVAVSSFGTRTGNKGHFFAKLAAPLCENPAGQPMYFFASHFSNVPQELLDQVKALW